MRFEKYLVSKSIPEWRKAYIDYKGLKKKLKLIEKHRNLNHKDEHIRLQNAIVDLDNELPRFKNRRPNRTQSSILDNRLIHVNRKVSLPNNLDFSDNDHDQLRSLTVLDQVLSHASEQEKAFFIALDINLKVISKFYDEKEKEAEAKYDVLKMQIQIIHDFAIQLTREDTTRDINEGRLNPLKWFKQRNSVEISDLSSTVEYNGDHHLSYNVAKSRLKNAITEYYRSLELLKSYKDLNELGFKKILKKFDKVAGWKGSPLYLQKLNRYHWIKSNTLESLIEQTEKLYSNEFANGHIRKALAKLRMPEKEKHFTFTTYRIGFFMGLSVGFFARSIQLATNPDVVNQLPYFEYNLQIYGCFLLPILFSLGFGFNTLVWTKYQISYKFIFEFDPRDNLDYREFTELPSLMLLILSILLYLDLSQTMSPLIPSELCPLLLFMILIAILTCPFPILYSSSRRWLAESGWRILTSPIYPVEFRDFFLADELNSLAYSFWTFSYFVCAYGVHWTDLKGQCAVKGFWFTPFLAVLPAWWRLLQCIRRYRDSSETVHLVNGLKYLTSIASGLVTGYRRIYPRLEWFWVLTCLINSSYSAVWDLTMDWGLFRPGLRSDRVFPRLSYYLAIPLNVLLRFAWVLTSAWVGLGGEWIGFVTALLEVYRRIQWNFFRLENEHINNCGNYRAIKEIPLPFALHETVKSNVSNAEEGAIHLPVDSSLVNKVESLPGSFYGRRDFENRQNSDETLTPRFQRQPSMVGVVLDHIIKKSTVSESSSEDDDSEENQQ